MIALAAAVALVAAASVPRPFRTGLTTVDIERAIKLGQSPGSEASQRFHDAYVILIGDPVLDRLEIVTEFRRVVLRTEDHVRLADITWGPRQAAEMLRPWRARISLVLHVTFSPRNVYYTMPRFGIVLYGRRQSQAQGRIEPLDLLETPRYISGQPAPPGTPILGGMVEATFDAGALDHRGVYLAGIDLEGREVRRVELDFGRVD
jgi:hypothetical protein